MILNDASVPMWKEVVMNNWKCYPDIFLEEMGRLGKACQD
jgi:hypothetical protein